MQITTNNNNTAVSLQPEFKDVRDKIYLRMMCGEHKEILQFIPHIMLEDMAVIFFILPVQVFSPRTECLLFFNDRQLSAASDVIMDTTFCLASCSPPYFSVTCRRT